MVYLRSFAMPTQEREERYFCDFRETCYTDFYPFGVFRRREPPIFSFDPITIFCGGNGSGKSTVLNVMAERLGLCRGAPYNRSRFFEDYVALCEHDAGEIPEASRIITSDDVFDYLLDIRCMNQGIDAEREQLMRDYAKYRNSSTPLRSLEDYETWKRAADAGTRNMSRSRFVKKHLVNNVAEHSNGESALMFFTNAIREDALYLLDEPENSLSAPMQLKLKEFLESSVRFFGCQFIISTHSPFLLAMDGAKIYDLDRTPPCVRPWTELENVRIWYDFFQQNSHRFP